MTIGESMIRLSIGIEDLDDLLHDLGVRWGNIGAEF
jgi:O-acetylhomoserine/O-acetylserine sulfhydrylase-like pyridoxal-dependent enzyme